MELEVESLMEQRALQRRQEQTALEQQPASAEPVFQA